MKEYGLKFEFAPYISINGISKDWKIWLKIN